MSQSCPCQSGQLYQDCCAQPHAERNATTAEVLMRSRYSAYVLGLVDYIIETTLPAQQALLDRAAIQSWSQESQWLGLEVHDHQQLGNNKASVTFTARWLEDGAEQHHKECSAFAKLNDRWFFIDPTVALPRERNSACPCGSGKKYKKCCSVA